MEVFLVSRLSMIFISNVSIVIVVIRIYIIVSGLLVSICIVRRRSVTIGVCCVARYGVIARLCAGPVPGGPGGNDTVGELERDVLGETAAAVVQTIPRIS